MSAARRAGDAVLAPAGGEGRKAGVFPRLMLLVVAVVLAPVARGEGEAELRAAVGALARTSHAWETTVRQRFQGTTTEPRIDPNAAVEVRGEFDPAGWARFEIAPTRELAVPVTAVARAGDVVALTPAGWVRRSALRPSADAAREVAFGGKTVRLARLHAAALKASALRPVSEDLLDLVADLKSVRTVQGLILGELSEKAIERLWGGAEARRAPDVHGTVIFKPGPDGLEEVHTVLGIGFPDTKAKSTRWTMQQWSTRIRGIGRTEVAVPEAAAAALDR